MFLSVIVPLFNEKGVVRELSHRLIRACDALDRSYEIIFVDDGSTDGTREILEELAASDERIVFVRLLRTFGQYSACRAGLDHAMGEVVVMMDGDLQDPPELIPALVRELEPGVDIVSAIANRIGQERIMGWIAPRFHSMLGRLLRLPPGGHGGTYSLMTRRVVDALCALREQDPFISGLRDWFGFARKTIPYTKAARYDGISRMGWRGHWREAVNALVSFSLFPLRIVGLVGLAAGGIGLIGSMRDLFAGRNPMAMVLMALIGINSMALWMLAEYVWKTKSAAESRPLYLVDTVRRGRQSNVISLPQSR